MHLKLVRNWKLEIGNSRAGFTLIELLITIFLVSVGLIGVISFFNSSLTSQFDAKNELIAAGLAQEGAELVRNLEEYKMLQPGSDWNTVVNWFQSSCSRIDYQSLTSHSCQTGDYVCFSGGRYQQCPSDSGNGMQRTLNIVYNLSDKSLTVTSSVTWSGRETKAVDILYENRY